MSKYHAKGHGYCISEQKKETQTVVDFELVKPLKKVKLEKNVQKKQYRLFSRVNTAT